MLDPSAYTIPYDAHLCRALARAGARVDLFSRPIRKADYFSKSVRDGIDNSDDTYRVIEHFYYLSERVEQCRLLPFATLLKGVEHLCNMTTFCSKLRRDAPDVVHFQWIVVPALDRRYVRLIRKRSRAVLTVHDTKALLVRSSWLQIAGWRSALADFDALIVHTECAKRELADHVDAARIHVIPHGILDSPAGSSSSAALPSKSRELSLLLFGAIKPYKGLDVLLNALALVPIGERCYIRLIVAGNPSMPKRQLQELADSLGVNQLIDWNLRYIAEEEIPFLVGRCDAIVFPYKEIDASGVLMKLLPYGKAIVASRLGLFSELLSDEESAILVEPNDPHSLALALRSLVADRELVRRLGLGAVKISRESITWESIAARTIAVYQQCGGDR
jgi:glycosyltransferase involved in cell wall biosynthesis